MRARASIFAIALCALAAACGSSSNRGSATGGSGGSATGGSGGSATGGSGGSATGGSGGTTQTSSVQGAVWTYLSEQATVPNATVAVLGTSLSTMTDASGAFSFANVPNGENFFTVDVAGYWGTVDYWDVPDETDSGFALYVVPDEAVNSMATQLGRTLSTQDGMVEVYFYPAVTGATATINPPNHDPPFTLNEDGDIKEQNTAIATKKDEADLFFTSVPAGGTITASVQGPSGNTCQVIQSDSGSFPVRAKAITVVYATCQ